MHKILSSRIIKLNFDPNFLDIDCELINDETNDVYYVEFIGDKIRITENGSIIILNDKIFNSLIFKLKTAAEDEFDNDELADFLEMH